jgi:hypothetical protein
LASHVRLLVNDNDDLREAWDTLNTCFDRPDKYISEALDPVIKYRSYKAFDSGAIREFYSLLRAAMMGAKKAGLLGRLINDQTLPGILARMPPTDWRQWAREQPNWMREATEEAFWNLVDQKWRDALNVAAAELPAWGAGARGKIAFQDAGKKEAAKLAKAGVAAVHVTGTNGRRPRQGDGGRACVFKDVMGCTGAHPPWICKVFGKLPAKEREKLITDNKLCPFCLLHDKDKSCGAKQRTVSVACTASGCKGRHAQKLHDFLKDVFREKSRVHIVHGDDGWEESDEAWELGEEEAMIVGTVQQETECSWQDTCNIWATQDEGMEAGVHQVGVDQGTDSPAKEGQCKEVCGAKNSAKPLDAGDLLVEGEEQEYLLELLMRRASPSQLMETPPSKEEVNPLKARKGKSLGKKIRRRKLPRRKTGREPREEKATDPAGGVERQVASNLAHNPEAKGRGLAGGDPQKRDQTAAPPPTSGGECSG